MYKKLISVILVAVLAVFAAIFLVNRQASNKSGIAVGVILPLTGDGAKYGEAAMQAIELAWQQSADVAPQLIYEDDQGQASAAIAAFQRLTSQGEVPVVIGPMYSSTTLAVAPIAERRKIVLFSPSASTPELTKAGDYIFRNWPSDTFEGGAMAKFVYYTLGHQRIAILGQNLDYALGITREFKKMYQVIGGEVIAEEYYAPGTTDFRTTLTKLKTQGANVVYLPGMYAEIAVILRQEKELGYHPINISCVGFDNVEVLKLAGDAAEGVFFARPAYDAESNDPLTKGFVNAFRTKYGTDPGVYAAHAYDAARIILSVIRAGNTTPQNIKKALYEVKAFPGVTGSTTFDEHGDVAKPIQFMKVQNGEFLKYGD